MSYDFLGNEYCYINELEDKTIIDFNRDGNKVYFHTACGQTYVLLHIQDCCEYVWLDTINFSRVDIVGERIKAAEKTTQRDSDASESGTITDFKIKLYNGDILRMTWIGRSNGYYGEGVSVIRMHSTENPDSDDSLDESESR